MQVIAYAALLLLVPATGLAFSFLKPHLAAACILVFGVLFLPERVAYDLPLVPRLDKQSLAPLLALIGILVAGGKRLRSAGLGSRLDWLALAMVASAIATASTNRDPLIYGPTVLPGLTTSDGLSDGMMIFLTITAPYLLGRVCFQSSKDARDLLLLVVLANLVYLPLILFEIRMSPQLHAMVYGFGQHSFGQTRRFGGYRPMVFMAHGLALAMLVYSGVIAAWTLVRARYQFFRLPASPIALVFSVMLVLVKSMGAVVYAAAAVPMLFARVRRQGLILTILCVIVITYPISRAADVFPTEKLAEWAGYVSEERRGSLQFRFDQEDALIQRARERVVLGWGRFGRSRVFTSTGQDASVTDGAWIIMFGTYGAVGFVLFFGVLTGSVIMAARAARRLGKKDAAALIGLAWITTMHTVDLLPNGLFSYLPLFYAGSLVGLSRGLVQEARRQREGAREAKARDLYSVRPGRAPATIPHSLPAR